MNNSNNKASQRTRSGSGSRSSRTGTNGAPTRRASSGASARTRSAGASGSRSMSRSAQVTARNNASRKSGAGSVNGARRSASSTRSASHAQQRSSAQARSRSSVSSRSGSTGIVDRIVSSKIAITALVVVALVLVVGIFDTAANWGKALGNVSVNGVNVSGKTEEEIAAALKSEYEQRMNQSRVTIYANEEAAANGGNVLSEEERRAIAEQISNEEAVSTIGSWSVDAQSLKAQIPYEQIAHAAVAQGRDEGGPLKRLSLLVVGENIPVQVQFDNSALETVAADIDRTIGEPREDSTVVIENGTARVQEGHSGVLVNRSWLQGKISDAMISPAEDKSFIAQAETAESRVSASKAQEMSDSVNKAISKGVSFTYKNQNWNADSKMLGEWTKIEIVDNGNGACDLKASIDTTVALPAIVKGAGAVITSDDMVVTFENTGDGTVVHTQGSGNIPEVNEAVTQLNDMLYGDNGIAWSGGEASTIEIKESDRPETLSFDDALAAGVITVIGEYTTEFSNQEGTESRNHNIKLAADLLNNGIVTANGGTWDFNDRSGPTDENAGFWSAGSIVNGVYEDSIGGGICQVATTVFNSVFEAGLPVKERHNHSLYIASYPTGRDAAVDYPDMTLIWANDLSSDVILKMSYTDDSVTAKLYSVYTGYTVESEEGEWEEGAKYNTRFEIDDTLGSGYYRKSVGANGRSITITRTVKDESGKTVSEDVFSSNYAAKDEIYAVGPSADTSGLR